MLSQIYRVSITLDGGLSLIETKTQVNFIKVLETPSLPDPTLVIGDKIEIKNLAFEAPSIAGEFPFSCLYDEYHQVEPTDVVCTKKTRT